MKRLFAIGTIFGFVGMVIFYSITRAIDRAMRSIGKA